METPRLLRLSIACLGLAIASGGCVTISKAEKAALFASEQYDARIHSLQVQWLKNLSARLDAVEDHLGFNEEQKSIERAAEEVRKDYCAKNPSECK